MKGVKKRVNITVSVPVSTSLRLEYTYIPWDQRRVTGTRDCGKGRWNMMALVFQSAIFSESGSVHPNTGHKMPGASIHH